MGRRLLGYICAPCGLLRTPKSVRIFVVSSVVFTTVFSVGAGTAQAAVTTLREYAQPVVLSTSTGRTTVDADGTDVENGFGPSVDATDIVVLADRRVVLSTTTDVVMLTDEGIPDPTFGVQGAVSGFTNITHLAVDETANRIYVLDAPTNETPTLTSMSLTGYTKGTTPSTGTVAITAGSSHLIAIDSDANNSRVFDLNLTSSRALTFGSEVPSFSDVADAAWLRMTIGEGIVIADRTAGLIRRLSLAGLETGETVTATPHPDVVPTPDIAFGAPTHLAVDEAGNTFVATGGTQAGRVLRLAADGQSTATVVISDLSDIPVVAVAPQPLEPIVVTDPALEENSSLGAAAITTGETSKFKIESLNVSTTNRTAMEVVSYTGDDHGGIGLSASKVFLRGDYYIGVFNKSDLSSPSANAPTATNDAMASDLKTMTLYGFDYQNGTTNFTKLTALDSSGQVPANPTVITLSSAIPYSAGEIYSGYGRVVYRNGSTNRVYDIDLPSGTVYDRGIVAVNRTYTETWASWGVAEFFDGELWLAVADGSRVIRYKVSDGTSQTIVNSTGFSDMASFIVDPTNQRWYFHYEGNATAFAFGSDETLGYTSAVITTTPAVTITPSVARTNANSMSFDVTFGEAVTGVAASDFSLGGTSTGWSITGLTANSSTNYTLNVSHTGEGDGTLNATLLANSVNWTAGSITIPDVNTASTNSTIDNAPPTVASITGASGAQTLNQFSFTLNMNETVTGLSGSDFSLPGISGCTFTTSASSGSSIAVTATGCAASGATAVVLAENSVTDAAGNTGPTSAYTTNLTSAPPTISVPTAVPVDTGVFVTLADRATPISISGIGAATVNVVVTASAGNIKLGTTTNLNAIAGYSSGNWTGNTSTTLGFNGTQSAVNTALASLQFKGITAATTPSISVHVTSGTTAIIYSSATNRYYERVTATLTWGQAQTAAAARTFNGRTGYLAVVTSAAENNFLVNTLGSGNITNTWLGGSDVASEGAWRWVTGPETNTQFWSGAGAGAAVGGAYTNWYPTEPNDTGANEDCLLYATNNQWNDGNCAGTTSNYLVEYGGLTADAPSEINIAGTATTLVAAAAPTVTGIPARANASTSVTATFVGSGQGGATFECKLDSESWTSCTSPTTRTGLSAGSHTFQIRENVSGLNGNPSTNTWIVDPIIGPPVATFTTSSTLINTSSTSYTVTFNENITGLTNSDFTNAGTATGCSFDVSGDQPGTTFTLNVTGCSSGTLMTRITANSVLDSAGITGPRTPLTLTTGTQVTGMSNPYGSAVTPDGTRLLTANNSGNTVRVYNTSNNALVANITVGTNPRHIVISADGTRAYVSNFSSSSVSVISTATWTVTATITVGTNPWGMVFTPDDTRLFVANGNGTVSAINTSTNIATTVISGLTNAVDVDISPDGTKLYVLRQTNQIIGQYNANTYAFIANTSATGYSMYGMAISPDGSKIYVPYFSASGAGALGIVTTSNMSLSSVSGVNEGVEVTVSADGTRVIVTQNTVSGSIKVFNTVTNAFVGSDITVGSYPWASALNNTGTSLYVMNNNSSSFTPTAIVAGAQAATITIDTTAPTASFTTTPVSPTNSSTATFAITFSKAISGLSSGDFTFSGTAVGCSATPAAASGTTINVSVNGCTRGGSVVLSLSANSVTDGAGNTGPATVLSSSSVNYDVVPGAPTASFTANPSSPTKATLLEFTLTFNEPVSGLLASEITNSGTATGCTIAISGTQPTTTFTVTVTTCSAGTVQLKVTAGAVVDNAGVTGPGGSGGTVNTVETTLTSIPNQMYSAVTPDGTRLLATSQGNNNVRVYSIPSFALLGTINVGAGPRGIAITPDGSTAYVVNINGSSVSVIRMSDYSVTSTIAVGNSPISVAINPAGTRAYVTNYGSGNISVINTSTNTVITAITAASPWRIVINSDGTRAYVGSIGGSVHVLDLATNLVIATITTGGSIYELNLNRAGNRLYASNYSNSQVHVINTATNTILNTISNVTGPMGVITTLDDSVAYVSNYSSGSSITRIDTATNTVLSPTIAVGANPWGISMTPDGTRMFVSNWAGSSVSVVFTTGGVTSNSIVIDRTPPTASFTASPTSSITTSGTYTVTFSKAITGLTASDFINTGTATDCVFTPTSSSGTAINVTVTNCSAGTLIARLLPNTVVDAASNNGPTSALTATSTSAVDPVPGAPIATWTTTPTTPTKLTQFAFGLTFNEAITGLEASDLSNVGTATNCVLSLTGAQPGTTFTVTATSCSEGTVKLKIASQSVADVSGTAGPGGSGTPNTVAATISNMSNVLGSALTLDGSRLYAANDGNSTVTVVNTSTRAITATINVGSNPRSVAMSPDGKRAYVTNYSSNSVSVISTATNAVTATISGFSSPQGIAISPDGTKLYVGNIGGQSISVVSTTLNTITTNIALGRSPWGVVINATGTRLYTGNYNSSTVSVVDTSNNTLAATINVGSSPYEVAVNRSGSLVYVANYGSGTVSVINTTTNTVTSTISGFTSPMAIVTSIDDSTLYVGQYGYSNVRTVNLSNNTINSGSIAAGTYPRTFAVSADGSLLYLNNYSASNNITIINSIAASQSSVVTVDRSGATATWGTPAAGTTTFPLTFNESVSGITASDFSNVGTSQGCSFAPSASTASAGTPINVVVSGCSTGTLILRLAPDSVNDAINNTGPAVNVDATSTGVDGVPGGPKASWYVPDSPFVASQTLSATLTFNERVIGLAASDITTTGTATGCEVAVTGTSPGTTFTVNASSCSEGSVAFVLSPSSVTDEALNAGPGTSTTMNTVIRTISGLSSAYYSVMSHDGSKIYVANTNANEVRVFSNTTGSAIAAIAVGASPRGIAISPKGDFIAVANNGANTVTIIRTSNNTVAGTITGVGTGPMGVAWAPNGRTVWVSNVSNNTVASLDTTSMTVMTSGIPTGAYPNAIVVSPDGSRVYTSNVNSNSVTVINTSTNSVASTITVGSNPYHLAISPTSARLVVSNYGASTASVINTATNAVVTTVSGLSSPMGIAITPDGARAYVANRGNSTIRAIDLTATTPILLASPTIALASQSPWGMSISADGSTLVPMFDAGARLMTVETGLVQTRTYRIDRTVPTASTFVLDNTAQNDLNEQSWTLTFSEEVTGLTASDFVLTGTSTGWSTPVVSGSGTTYNITTTHGTPSSGTVGITLNSSSVVDTAGNSGPTAEANGATATFAPSEGVFKIDSLLTTGSTKLEVGSQTGDDRGGMALTTSQVLLTGDSNIARFGLSSLGSPTAVAVNNQTWMDAIASDLKTMRAYAFNLNSARNGNLTTLTALDASTGLPTSTVITLSSPIPVSTNSAAIFSGYGRIVVAMNNRIYDVSVPGGIVTDRGAMSLPPRSMSESWATWGVAEYFGGRLYITYVRSNTTIERARVPDGEKTTIATFTGLSDMASFVVNPRNNRWYFHYEGNAPAFAFGSDETIGFANATTNVGGTSPSSITNLVASTRSTTALLTWDAPTTGPTPTDYLVEYSTNGGTSWTWVNDGVSTATNASVPSLAPGITVTFRVTTVSNLNAAPSVLSDASLVSPYASAPTITSIATGNTQLTANFTAPTVIGASAITNYQFSTDGGTTWTTRSPASTASPIVMTGLTNGTAYDITIRAINSSGSGDASVVSTATPSTIASAPSISAISPSASQTLSIAFTPPTSNGGNSITNYQYSLNGGVSWVTRSPAATTSPLVVTGLANGSSYSVVIRAVNVNGGGTSSNAVSAIPGVVPSAPTITSVSTGDETFSAMFSPPASNGSIAITNYEYSTDGVNWITRSPASTASPLVISSLTNGTTYAVRIRAVNPAGSSPASSSASGTPSRVADAPTISAIEPSSSRLRVSYTAPTFDGGAVITNYQYSINDGSTWTALNPVSTSGSFSITGLTNARAYPIRVRAVNIRGAGAPSSAVSGTPATTPGAPTISAINPSNGQLSVAFTAGADNGAAPTNYEYSVDDGASWIARSPASISSPVVITGLTNGDTYPVRLRSVNSQGSGGASAASDGTPATTPSAPTIVSVTPGNNRLTVEVTSGATGGASITNYEYSTDNGISWTTRTPASAASPIVIGGLTNGTSYQVRARAVNSQGSGTQSAATSGRPATTPGAPVINGITGDPGQISVAFSAPSSDGGSSITNYEFSTDGGTTWTLRNPASTTSPVVVTGLIDGTVYSVKVRGVNAQGSGSASATVEGTPVNTPGNPTINRIISGSGSLKIDFSAAPARGAVVTNYEYSLDNGTSWVTLDPAAVTSPITVNNLTNGTTYQVKVRGVNSRGSGLASASVSGTPSAPPAAPTISGIQVGNVSGSLSIAFTAGNSGGASITDTEYSVDGGTSWTSASSATSPVIVTGLTNGTSYSVKLRSVNVRGAGAASTAMTGTPIWAPGAPSLTSVSGANQTLTLYFGAPTDTGGSTVTNYAYSTDGGTTWVTRSPASISRPLTISALTNGTAYNVMVRGINAYGQGTASNSIGAKPATVPGAPTITSVTGTNTSLTVAFTAPSDDGGEAVSSYEYSIDNGQVWKTRSPLSSATPLVISGLTNATDYTVKLRAVNVQGPGAESTGNVGRPAGAPNAPTISGITSMNGGLSVAYVAGSDNGATITNFEYSTDNGVTWETRSPASSASPLEISNLTNGTSYRVKIRAINSQGSGVESAATTAVPATTPSATTIDSVSPLDGALAVIVSDGDTGGAEITSYKYSTNNGVTWTATPTNSQTFNIPSLLNGSSYAVKVRAVNRMGDGEPSSATSAIPSRTPFAPTISSIAPGNGRLTIAFTEGGNGGSATTTLRYSLNGGTTWTSRSSVSTASPLVIDGLTNGTSYNIKLQMVNANGNGDPSLPTAGTPSTVPDAPSIASITSGNRSLTVAVTAPANNGGTDILNYEYSLDNGSTWTTESSAVSTGSFTISSLTNGTRYAVKIRALNARGFGSASTATNATPSTTPSMPAIKSVTPGDQLVVLEFALGASGGSPITNIEYSIDDGTNWTTRSPASLTSPLTIAGLSNGVTYPIRLRAVNANGSGISSRSSGTPATVPDSPTITRVVPGNGTLTVEFESPADNGGAEITNYAYSVDGGTLVVLSPVQVESPFTISGLDNGTDYSIELLAINNQGNGSRSTAVVQSPATTPGAPTLSSPTVSDQTLTLNYYIVENGGRAITSMDYSLDDGDTWTSVPGNSSPITVTGLSNGTTYDVKIRARNSVGLGLPSTTRQLTPASAPLAPTINDISRGDGELTVNFTPGGNGGAAITNFEYSTDGGTSWTTPDPEITSSPVVISGLTNATTYDVKLRGVNSQGAGIASSSVSGTPATVPSAPTISSITRADEAATVNFTLGSGNGDTITNVQYSINGGLTWTTRNPASVASPLALTNLTNGNRYAVQLRGVNAMGEGVASTSTNVTPATTPSAPTITAATGENGRVVVSFEPNGDGGDAITNYAYSSDNGASWTTLSPATTVGPILITGLSNGTTYSIRLKAINSVGQSAPSTATAALPSGPPSAPTISVVTAADSALLVNFVAGFNGGAPISSYQVSTNGGRTWADAIGTESPITVTGLLNGVAYPIALRAVNSRGPGTASSAENGTPATTPDSPQITQVISASGSVDVAFSFGGDGGSPITNIAYSIDNGDTWTTRSPASTAGPLTLTGLTNGTTYPVMIRAINVRGSGTPSSSVNALPATTPSAPVLTEVTSGNGALNVSFTAPTDNGGAPILNYEYSLDGGDNWTSTPESASPIEINDVTVGTAYDVALRAVNLRGPGTSSNASTKRATAPPTAPFITSVVEGNGEIILRYAPPVDSGGETLQDYFYTIDGGVNWEPTSNAQSSDDRMSVGILSVVNEIRLGQLQNGQSYSIGLRASNTDVLGVPSQSVLAIPSTVPTVVRNFVVESFDSGISIAWENPTFNGGLEITGYEYTLDNGVMWNDVIENPTVIRGLTNGTTYQVMVRAKNANGAGPTSALTATKPLTVPRTTGIPVATAGELSANLTWTAPTDTGGSPITDYIIEYSTNNGATWSLVNDGVNTATSVTVKQLKADATYTFRVTAVTTVGSGEPSISSNSITPTAPPIVEQPKTPAVEAPNTAITIPSTPTVVISPQTPTVKKIANTKPDVPTATPNTTPEIAPSTNGQVPVAPKPIVTTSSEGGMSTAMAVFITVMSAISLAGIGLALRRKIF